MKSVAEATEPVDVVLTWVDGNDPAHQAKLANYSDYTAHQEATLATRFDSSGEIYLAVASILKYLPFVRTIWIVTDEQSPIHLNRFVEAGLCQEGKIRIVDHQDILSDYDGALPTFNSLTIESALWRIPGIANRYIYMNDDFMVLQPLNPNYFFDGNVPLVRGERVKPDHKRFRIKLRKLLRKLTGRPSNRRPSYRVSQERGANEAGVKDDFILVGHWPHPQVKSIQENFHAKHPDVLPTQVQHRFRSVEQYNPVSLTYHLAAPENLMPPPKMAYVKPGNSARVQKSSAAFFEDDSVFGCIQSLDQIQPDHREELLRGLRDRMGAYLPFDPLLAPAHREDEKG